MHVSVWLELFFPIYDPFSSQRTRVMPESLTCMTWVYRSQWKTHVFMTLIHVTHVTQLPIPDFNPLPHLQEPSTLLPAHLLLPLVWRMTLWITHKVFFSGMRKWLEKARKQACTKESQDSNSGLFLFFSFFSNWPWNSNLVWVNDVHDSSSHELWKTSVFATQVALQWLKCPSLAVPPFWGVCV